MNLVMLSQRIRKIRNDRGMTLEQVAERTGLTRSVLSKVENFRVTPSLPALGRIAGALGVSLAELVEGLDERPQHVIVKRGEGTEIDRDKPVSPLRYFDLAIERPSKAMEPFLIEIPPGQGRDERMAHEGEEFLYVIEGSIQYWYGDEEFVLNAGDCLYADGAVEHALRNIGECRALFINVYSASNGTPLD